MHGKTAVYDDAIFDNLERPESDVGGNDLHGLAHGTKCLVCFEVLVVAFMADNELLNDRHDGTANVVVLRLSHFLHRH